MKHPAQIFLNKQKCHIFYKNREQEGKTSPVWGVVASGKGEDITKWVSEGEYDRNSVYTYM
jgi:hypothetical protein